MRIMAAVDERLRKEQAGFRPGRGTTEHTFMLRNILEQCNKWQKDIYVNFLDFEKAFDSVHRTSLWKILRQYGIPQKIVYIITLFHNNFTCCVQNSSSSFAVNSGVRQGCVMSSFPGHEINIFFQSGHQFQKGSCQLFKNNNKKSFIRCYFEELDPLELSFYPSK